MPNLEKKDFSFGRGINTEASLINFPDGFSTDEENYELFIDTSRRRRRGLDQESGGTPFVAASSATDAVTVHRWDNVANNPELDFIMVQVGSNIHLYQDINPPSANKSAIIIDLLTVKVETALDADVATSPIDVAFAKGKVYIAGKFIQPSWISYDPDSATATITQIVVFQRDFEGIDDGVSNTAQPITPTNSHTYNLYNRGWKAADLTAFRAAQPNEPSKAMVPWLGYRRKTTANVAEQDWTKEFSDAKLVAELFQDASAPQGHFIINSFTTSQVSSGSASNNIPILTWTITGTTGGYQTITVTTDGAHGLNVGDTTEISGQQSFYFLGHTLHNFVFNGFRVVTVVPAADQFSFRILFPTSFGFWQNQYTALGTASGIAVANDTTSGFDSTVRPTAVAFFAGRLWLAGAPHEKLTTKIFFSQVIEGDAQYGKCYQVADPTDERISDLVDTDGGVITIPEITNVYKLIPYGSSLLVYAQNGIWQIGPGQSGYFTATSYSVRKITDIGVESRFGVVMVSNIPYYTSHSDIYRIVQDPRSGFLVTDNISELQVNTLYKGIADRTTIQAVNDDFNKRVIFLYTDSTGLATPLASGRYNKALVYDTRLKAFIKFTYPLDGTSTVQIAEAFTLKEGVSGDPAARLKYVVLAGSGTSIQIAEHTDATFLDYGIEREAFLVTGYLTAGNPERKKYGHYVYVFSRKTETGFIESAGSFLPIGESSTKLQARWDWADRSSAGKWGTPQEAYRHRRLYTPASIADGFDDGQPVVTTRNKIRGSGKSLHLKFTAGPGKDSWIMGWSTTLHMNQAA